MSVGVGACSAHPSSGPSVPSSLGLDGIWFPVAQVCSATSRAEERAELRACGIARSPEGWQWQPPLAFHGGLVTIRLVWVARSLRTSLSRRPGYYTLPFRERRVPCAAIAYEFRNPQGHGWTPFARVVEGRLSEVSESGCGSSLRRAAHAHPGGWPQPLLHPPAPFLETGDFVEFPRDLGFEEVIADSGRERPRNHSRILGRCDRSDVLNPRVQHRCSRKRKRLRPSR